MSNRDTAVVSQSFGVVTVDGKEATLTQSPYVIDIGESVCGDRGPIYTAMAQDEDENEYRIVWDVVDGWEDFEDESDCCDWSVFRVYAQ